MEGSIGGRLSRLPALTALALGDHFLARLRLGRRRLHHREAGGTTTTSEASSDQPFAPNVVADVDIEVQEEGSPGRALLEWWQAISSKTPTESRS